MSDLPSGGGRSVPSVKRAAQILDAVGSADEPIALSELSRTLSIARSTALNICTTLVDSGLLARVDPGGYRLGPAVVALGRGYLDQSDIVSEFKATPLDEGPLSSNTLVLSTLDGAAAVYLARRPGSQPGGLTFHVGDRIPAHCSASGIALLSRLPADEIRRRYRDEQPLATFTAHSISSIEALLAELEATRQRGFAIDDEGTALGMLGLGVALVRASGEVPVGIGISLIKSTVPPSDRDTIGRELGSLAERLNAGGPNGQEAG